MSITNDAAVPRQDLMVLGQEHVERESYFIGEDLLPLLDVPGSKYEWPEIKIEDLLEVHDTLKGEDGKYPKFTTKVGWRQDEIHKHGLETDLDPDKAARYSDWFDAEAFMTQQLIGRLRRSYEKQCSDLIHVGAAMAGFETAVGTVWSNAISTPVVDAKVARDAVFAQCGLEPNVVQMSRATRSSLGVHPDIRGFLQQTEGRNVIGDAGDEAVARALGVREILVGRAKENTADEGLVATTSEIWPETRVLFAVKSEGRDFESEEGLGIGRTPIWRESTDALFQIEDWIDPSVDNARMYRVKHYAEPKILSARFGHVLTGTA